MGRQSPIAAVISDVFDSSSGCEFVQNEITVIADLGRSPGRKRPAYYFLHWCDCRVSGTVRWLAMYFLKRLVRKAREVCEVLLRLVAGRTR